MMIACIILAVLSVILLLLDWRQTLYIARHPECYSEINPMLGKHPSVAAVNVHFLARVALALAAFAVFIYLGWYPTALAMSAVLVAVEGYCVWHNSKLGIKLTGETSA